MRPTEMVTVPSGPFLTGTTTATAADLAAEHGYHPTWFSGETPQERVSLDGFEIDAYPVTNAAYRDFCADTGRDPPSHWEGSEPLPRTGDHPVVSVDRGDAAAYAEWAGKRLPTESEWEKAARGTNGRQFPWGDEFDPENCCWNRSAEGGTVDTAPVTEHESGASPYGAYDMVGNAAEWCADAPLSRAASAGQAAPGPGPAAVKGGAWLTTEVVNLRPAGRTMSGFSDNAHEYYGFRCARDLER